MQTTAIVILDEVQCQELDAFLVERIYEFNSKATGYFDGRLLGASIRNDAGEVIAGISGHTWGGSAEISNFWVSQHHRGQRLGTTLLRAAEAEAIRRGCTQLVLRTHSFQAPGFYARRGYEKMYEIEAQPKGHSDIIFIKSFPSENATGRYSPTTRLTSKPSQAVPADQNMGVRNGDSELGTRQLRVARHTERLDQVVAFYRDGIGLPEIGCFRDHDGYDGVFLAIPGTGAHLELTGGGAHGAPTPHPESLLVLYVGDEQSRDVIAARLGVPPVAAANPYWAQHGSTFEDPDGFRVVLVPERWPHLPEPMPVSVEPYAGTRAELRALFELAEDSERELESYLHAGRVLVARLAGEPIGYVQIVATERPGESEIKSIAVRASYRRRGVGLALVEAAARVARETACSNLVVATATADIGNLRFYQRVGFRMRSVDRDVFTPAAGYPRNLRADGIEVRDRVWFERRL